MKTVSYQQPSFAFEIILCFPVFVFFYDCAEEWIGGTMNCMSATREVGKEVGNEGMKQGTTVVKFEVFVFSRQ